MAAGVLFGVTVSPVVRKGLRAATVKTAKAVLTVTDTVRGTGEKISEGFSGIFSEARTQQEVRAENMKSKVHDVGVAAIGTGLTAVDKVKEVAGGMKQKWDGLVTEAKELKEDTGGEIEETEAATPEKTL